MNQRLMNLFIYFQLLKSAYYEGDPLNVQPSIEKVMLLIEMELNKAYGEVSTQ